MASLIKKLLAQNNGTTLIELLVYMGIFMGLFLVVSNLFASTLDLQRLTSDTALLDQEAQFLYSRLKYDVMRSTAMTQPAISGQGQTLELTTASGTVRYFLNGTQLMLSVAGDTQPVTTDDVVVSELLFERVETGEAARHATKVRMVLESNYSQDQTPETRVIQYTLGNQ